MERKKKFKSAFLLSAVSLSVAYLLMFNSVSMAQEVTPTIGGIGYTVDATFPDDNLAQAVADVVSSGNVNAILTQPMIDNCLYLMIQNKNIADLTGIDNLTNLQIVNANGNELTSLPDSIGTLTDLIYMSVGRNELTSLPDTIGNLTNLDSLWVFENKLTSLPASIGNLSKLTYLDIGTNELTSFPDSLLNLPAIEFIISNDNQLTALPNNIGNLSTLVKLDFENNALTTLPDSIGNLTELKELFLRNNELTSLPESFGNLQSLHIFLAKDNLLPTNYDVTLNELGIPDLVLSYEEQRQLALKAGSTSYLIKKGSDLSNLDLLSAVEINDMIANKTFPVSTSHNLILQEYYDEQDVLVDINDYIQDDIVIKSGMLYAPIRATGVGIFPNNSDHAITIDRIQLNLEASYYSLSFDLNGATGVIPPTQSLIEGRTGVAVSNPIRGGFTFLGWNTKQEGSGTKWVPETTPMIASNVILYAQWQENEKKVLPVAVTFPSPKTGDDTNVFGYSIILAMTGVVWLILRKKENQA